MLVSAKKQLTELRDGLGKKRLVICVASLGDYRANVIKQLRDTLGGSLSVYAGSPAYDSSIHLLDYEDSGVHRVRNWYLPGNVLIQTSPIAALLAAETLVLDLNPRVPQVWLITGLRRLLGRRTMLWGHAWSRSGPRSIGNKIRGMLRSLATGVVTYTETQAEALRGIAPDAFVIAAPNALYSSDEMVFEPNTKRFRIIFVGRLVREKKPHILLESFIQVAEELPDVVLTFVGEGPERSRLEQVAGQALCSDRVEFKGHIADLPSLRQLYAQSIVSVSPGYVGLSITQTLAFGVPMIVSDDENHSPEVEAVRPGFNAEFFTANDRSSLGQSIRTFVKEASVWQRQGIAIVDDCRRRYSTEKMALGLATALTNNR